MVHEVVRANKTLEVASIDLSKPPGSILQQVQDLSDRVRALRERSGEGVRPLHRAAPDLDDDKHLRAGLRHRRGVRS
jgi:hypothetical protein